MAVRATPKTDIVPPSWPLPNEIWYNIRCDYFKGQYVHDGTSIFFLVAQKRLGDSKIYAQRTTSTHHAKRVGDANNA